MKILIIGSGGREHALAWKISKNKTVKTIFAAPGNAGTAITDKCQNVDLHTKEELLKFAKDNTIDVTIVGPEKLLVEGIVDLFKENNLKIFGPHAAAAELEGSKVFAKDFMKKYNVATAKYRVFTDSTHAIDYVKTSQFPLVVKADGLANGKGVVIANNIEEAIKAINDCMVDKIFKKSGDKIVIEEFLTGVEASIICVTDGKTILPFASGKDHKQIFDDNKGPNTGGMGVLCPNPAVTKSVVEEFEKNIMTKTLEGIKDSRLDYCGFLFFGIMITPTGVKLLEYNVRSGDPETQSILPLLKNDLLEVILHSLEGTLEYAKLRWRKLYAVSVVLACKGYPTAYEIGQEINMPEWVKKHVFFSGAKLRDDKVMVTDGGRILSVVGKCRTRMSARFKAYFMIKLIRIKNIHYRKDIGATKSSA